MLERFNQFILENNLLQPEDKLLLAISGGADSMVLANLLLQSKATFELAHCNFQLRGEDSEADEVFVCNWGKENGVAVHVKKVDLSANSNVQLAAREARYHWFNELLDQEKLDKIVTAHHANDMVETMFINLLRGTGHKGWAGIPLNNQGTIRPLLFATKSEIIDFAKQQKIAFREDASNQSEKYLRNKIRHQIIPALEEINTNAIYQISENQLHLQASNALLKSLLLDANKEAIVHISENEIVIDYNNLNPRSHSNLVLFEILQDYGFNWAQIQMIFRAKQSGKQWSSLTHFLLLDRDRVLIRPKTHEMEDVGIVEVYEHTSLVEFPIRLSFSAISAEGLKFPTSKGIAALDLGKLEFPLILRRWEIGDRFQPIGMQGSKLLSDLFNDLKLNNFKKESVYILTSRNVIAWVVGYRISEVFKIDSSSKQCLIVEYLDDKL